jgi:hypothetical protein
MDHLEKQSTQKSKTRDEDKQHKQTKTQTTRNFCLAYKEFEDTKGAIRIRISTKNRQHNGQIKVQKDKQKTPAILLIYSVNSGKSLGSDRGKKTYVEITI